MRVGVSVRVGVSERFGLGLGLGLETFPLQFPYPFANPSCPSQPEMEKTVNAYVASVAWGDVQAYPTRIKSPVSDTPTHIMILQAQQSLGSYLRSGSLKNDGVARRSKQVDLNMYSYKPDQGPTWP